LVVHPSLSLSVSHQVQLVWCCICSALSHPGERKTILAHKHMRQYFQGPEQPHHLNTIRPCLCSLVKHNGMREQHKRIVLLTIIAEDPNLNFVPHLGYLPDSPMRGHRPLMVCESQLFLFGLSCKMSNSQLGLN
jgi:hypothetical protein